MPKRVFWPIALIIMGTVVLAANLRLLPVEFFNLWPLILIITGLGGLLLSDRESWSTTTKVSSAAPARKTMPAKKTIVTKKTVSKKAPAKKIVKSRKK